jgi:uncharacterized Zn finger protein
MQDDTTASVDMALKYLDKATLAIEALRTAAQAHDSDGKFVERVSETGEYRSAAFREGNDSEWVVEVEETGDELNTFTFSDSDVERAIREDGDVLGVRGEVQMQLASGLEDCVSDLRNDEDVDDVLSELIRLLGRVPGVQVHSTGTGTQGRVSFGNHLADTDGTSIFIPEGREAVAESEPRQVE